MPGNQSKRRLERLFSLAGITVNGSRPWDVQVTHERFYRSVLAGGSLGLGESYMEGWWDAEHLDQFFYRLLRAKLDKCVISYRDLLPLLKAKISNMQSCSWAFFNGEHHYNLGNDLYRIMLDRRMIYSCGYWKHAANLDEAQEAKLDLVCQKLRLKPGMKVLDIGCGWGGAARYAAEHYRVQVVGITVSSEQAALASRACEGLPVEIRLQDYRDVHESFDRIFSIGMFEHVGYKNYAAYMESIKKLLHKDGLFLLHTIGNNLSVTSTDTWINKYIFPNSMLPSGRQICEAAEGVMVMEDWHNFGPDYDRTLMAWFRNFDAGWERLRNKYGMRFYRMWKYYLLSCAASFRARRSQLWQIVFSPEGVLEGYQAPRCQWCLEENTVPLRQAIPA